VFEFGSGRRAPSASPAHRFFSIYVIAEVQLQWQANPARSEIDSLETDTSHLYQRFSLYNGIRLVSGGARESAESDTPTWPAFIARVS
jgi:hypothetical protein